MKEIAMTRSVIEEMIDKLEEIEDASLSSTLASSAAWKLVHDIEAINALAKQEIMLDVNNGVENKESGAYALKWLARVHKSAVESAELADMRNNESKGALTTIKWAIELVEKNHKDHPAPASKFEADIRRRKEKSND